MKRIASTVTVVLLVSIILACTSSKPTGVETDPAGRAQHAPTKSFDDHIEDNAKAPLKEGKRTFRYDTFGSEDFWGGKLLLHEAIAGAANGGVGPGVTARQALQLGLKVDVGALNLWRVGYAVPVAVLAHGLDECGDVARERPVRRVVGW